MLPLALLTACAATLAVADPSPNLRDVLGGIVDKVQAKAQNLLGLDACPAPFLLPTSCYSGQSPSTQGLNVSSSSALEPLFPSPFLLGSPRARTLELALSPTFSEPSTGFCSTPEQRQTSVNQNADAASPRLPRPQECCTNVPGGLQLQTQFWNAQPDIGPKTSWTVHGLWPDKCDGSFAQYCDPSRAYPSIRSILQDKGETQLLETMSTYWKSNTDDDDSLWVHEWAKVRRFSCSRQLEKVDDADLFFVRAARSAPSRFNGRLAMS